MGGSLPVEHRERVFSLRLGQYLTVRISRNLMVVRR